MPKRILWFSLLCAALVAGILACLIYIARMLTRWPQALHAGAQFVRGASGLAAL